LLFCAPTYTLRPSPLAVTQDALSIARPERHPSAPPWLTHPDGPASWVRPRTASAGARANVRRREP
jgi:hypothetical protein